MVRLECMAASSQACKHAQPEVAVLSDSWNLCVWRCRQWLPREKVTPLGVDDTADKLRIMEGRKSSIRKSVQVAYDRAMIHQSRVSHSQGYVASNYL